MKNLYFTITNEGYVLFVVNFLKRLKEINFQEDFLIACTDNESFNFLNIYHENVLKFDFELSKNFEKWQTNNYKDIVFSKLDIKKSIIKEFSNQYDNIIFIDTDIWINRNFSNDLNNILENNEYDIIFQDGEDYLYYQDECCFVENKKLNKKRYCNSFCTGFMVMNCKSTDVVLDLLSHTEEEKQLCNGNQEYINKKLYFKNLNVLTIPKNIFPNYSIRSFYKKNKDYWMLHYTYLEGKKKIDEMKKNNHWLIDEKYYAQLKRKKTIDSHQEVIKHKDNLYEIKCEWQEPTSTELHYFNNHLQKNFNNDFVYIGYSWANHIDKGKLLTQETIEKIRNITKQKTTVCQHIRWKYLIDLWRKLEIQTVFLSHCEKNTKYQGINFKPWPLFATNYFYCDKEHLIKREKKYLASFIGAHRKDYRSDIRSKLKEYFDKNKRQDIFYKLNEDWFYQKNIFENKKFDKEHHRQEALVYNQLLCDSTFSLCPEGTGPNTIRVWESTALGSIPVIYSDEWLPPQIKDMSWDEFSIFIPQKDYEQTIDILSSISEEKIKTMQKNCIIAFNKFNDMTCNGNFNKA